MFEEDFDDEDIEITLEEEIEMIDAAYNNAFKFVTKRATITELMAEQEDILFLPFDPDVPETVDMILDDMITYFEDGEEYEKCSELAQIKKERNL